MSYDDVRVHDKLRIRQLEKEVELWKARAIYNWEVVEAVATGERLFCETCQKYHPCGCDGESKK